MKRDEEEVRQIFERYGDDLYRLCYFYMKNVHDASDAVQNTLVKLMEFGGSFESESHKKYWLLKVGVNECRQLHRQWWRKKVTAEESVTDRIGQQDISGEHELLDRVLELPEKYRVAIFMHYYEDYTAEEIGNLMGKPASTVRSWLLRGRKLLRSALEDTDFEESKEGKAVSQWKISN